MGIRRFDLERGSKTFEFSSDMHPKIVFWLAKYPEDRKRSAVIPLLWLAQKDNNGWLSEPAMRTVADLLGMPYIRVYEVATFYTMFQLKPVGRHHVQLCGTTPCMLRGASDLKEVCIQRIGQKNKVTDDGRLSWEEVECLGACVNAPMVQINDYYYEDLTPAALETILGKLGNGVDVAPGNFVERDQSAPQGKMTSLKLESLYDGSVLTAFKGLPNMPAPKERTGVAMLTDEGEPPRRAYSTEEAVAYGTIAYAMALWGAPRPKMFGEIESFDQSSSAPVGLKPKALSAPKGQGADDLKRISGVGPVIEKKLHALGIYHFKQIAEWSSNEIAWVDDFLTFKGRIEREDWILQAKKLAEES